jgi:hypothetical protein
VVNGVILGTFSVLELFRLALLFLASPLFAIAILVIHSVKVTASRSCSVRTELLQLHCCSVSRYPHEAKEIQAGKK